MGSWGKKAFQNDSALDWLAELEAGGVATLRLALSRVADTDEDDYVDVDDGAAAIAAAEVVAAALGHGRDRVTGAASAWLDANQGSLVTEDATLAARAVDRVLAGRSELRQLRDENGPNGAWHADVRTLLDRLTRDAGAAASTPRRPTRGRTSGSAQVHEREKQALLTFLLARGLEPNAQQIARIHASQDAVEIRRWLARVVDAASVAAMLDV